MKSIYISQYIKIINYTLQKNAVSVTHAQEIRHGTEHTDAEARIPDLDNLGLHQTQMNASVSADTTIGQSDNCQ